MDELDEIRKKKLEELKQNQLEHIQQQQAEQAQVEQQLQMLESMVKQKLTKKALERYGNIKVAHPDKAVQLLVILGQAIQSQQIDVIDDDEFKEILKRMEPKKEIKITRK